MIAKKILTKKLRIAIMLMSAALSSQAFSQSEMAVLMQLSPVDGGDVNPGLGLHSLSQNSKMALTAVPKPGYQFLYWIGNVAEPTSPRTVALVDNPKIIIAVFERSEYDFLNRDVDIKSLPFGGLTQSNRPFRVGLDSSMYGRPFEFNGQSTSNGEVPVPDTGEVPVPDVPEPTTIALMSMGALFLRYRTAKDKLRDTI